MISTVKKNSSTEKNANVLTTGKKIENLLQGQLPLFNQLDINNPYYQPRTFFIDKGVEGIGFFEGELKKGTDIYTERVSKDFLFIEKRDPKNPLANSYGIVQTPYKEVSIEQRPMYVWKYRADWEEIYHVQRLTHDTKQRIFFIPVNHLKPLPKFQDISQQELKLDEVLSNDNKKNLEDIPLTEMSVRDYAAIVWRKPVSLKPWINQLINSIKQ